ncbi:hypothetical protein ACH44C_15990 [Streptomyces purpureus]|uniref:hypothetical protein n=1 Tax=Streptomyces purpureus TaxID=1951 RepID=UPI001319D4D5|nr:hypothetical protein [Streptomyces purpureus]
MTVDERVGGNKPSFSTGIPGRDIGPEFRSPSVHAGASIAAMSKEFEKGSSPRNVTFMTLLT